MRAATAAAIAVALGAWWLASRAEARSTGRGDAEYDDYVEFDNFTSGGDFVGPPDFLMEFPMSEPGEVLDPRDVLSRAFSPSQLAPSDDLTSWLKSKEGLSLERYELGDGGVTIGYGHYEPYSRAHLVPERITLEDAEAMFAADLESRGARWVREYVTTPLTQNEFDALTSLAFNLSPRSFKRIADALNAGEDWREVARTFVRPDLPELTRGLKRRREAEIAMFDSGVYPA